MTKRAARAAVVVMVLLALVGCGSGQPVSSPPPALSDAPPNEVSGTDIPPGRIDEAISKVDGLVNDLMHSTGVPGMSVAIVRGGKAVYAKGFGARMPVKARVKTTRSTLTPFSSLPRCRNRWARPWWHTR
ncbi:hypothetical protein ATCCBAA256_13880 [Mycobacterium montefiorense]|nr:hypothetical protein ATCCBAA256_13880 [Mycobacterium montefiorense]